MPSGSIQVDTYISLDYSYTVEDTGNAIAFKFTMSEKCTASDWPVSGNPKVLFYTLKNVQFDQSTISDLTGAAMINFVESKGGGHSQLYNLGDGNIGNSTFAGPATFTMTVPKTTSSQNITVYFGSAIQSTYFWTRLAGSSSFSYTIPSSYKAPTFKSGYPKITNVETKSFTVVAAWNNGTATAKAYCKATGVSPAHQLADYNSTTGEYSFTYNGVLNSNWHYDDINVYLADNEGPAVTKILKQWTRPMPPSISATPVQNSEYNSIIATATFSNNPTGKEKFMFKKTAGEVYETVDSDTYTFTGLTANHTYTIYVRVLNPDSGYQSETESVTVTTWHNPISGLACTFVKNWFWYLSVRSIFTYTGTITNYEFDIGGEGYQNKGTTNVHERGATTFNGANKLTPNTSYTCKVRLTDNHGRTAEASATFKTLDSRCNYVNGVLRDCFIIKSDGSSIQITPDKLSIVKSDGSVINMNQIINNDSRTSFS